MGTIDQLFAEVYANPDDDHIRRVLADALLSIGDPRGELIQSQLESDKDDHRRAMRLVQQHGLTWLGPLRDIVIPLAYERGFVAACAIVGDNTGMLSCLEWSTVHTIDASDKPREIAFALGATMRSLRRLVLSTPLDLVDLLRTSRDWLTSLEIETDYDAVLPDLLERHLPYGICRGLTVHGVPEPEADRIRVAAAGLGIVEPRVVPVVERYDEVDE